MSCQIVAELSQSCGHLRGLELAGAGPAPRSTLSTRVRPLQQPLAMHHRLAQLLSALICLPYLFCGILQIECFHC